jgi:hypothetical protein
LGIGDFALCGHINGSHGASGKRTWFFKLPVISTLLVLPVKSVQYSSTLS